MCEGLKYKRTILFILVILLMYPINGLAIEEPMYPEDPIAPEVPQTPELEKNMDFIGEKIDLNYIGGYVRGYEDGRFGPEEYLSRAELAASLYRLLRPEYIATIDNVDCDLKDIGGHWAGEEIETLFSCRLATGYLDNSFRPDKSVTRGEFAMILAKLGELDEASDSEEVFVDIDDYWGKEAVKEVASKGWIRGYNDGSFRPNQKLTRAEFVTVINKIIDRDSKSIDDRLILITFKDITKDKWYYNDVLLATNLN